MSDKKISQLSAASLPLAGTEVLPIVQSNTTVKVASDDLTVKNIRSNATNGLLQVVGPAAASTRVMTTPDANFTVARTDAAQTFTGTQTMGGLIVNTDGSLYGVNVGRGGGNQSTNTRVGNEALKDNTNGISNTAVGKAALTANTTGDFNTAVGFTALSVSTGSNNNTAVGAVAMGDKAAGSNNTAIGYAAGYVLEGAGNTLLGAQAGFELTTGADDNTLIGATAGSAITTGDGNVVIGNYTGNNIFLDIRVANNHAVISDGAGTIKQYWDASGNAVQLNGGLTVPDDGRFNQVYVGHGGGDVGTNTRVGEEALKNNTVGFSNTAVGKSSLIDNTTGDWNTGVGFVALASNIGGNYNTAFGAVAMADKAAGDNNTAIGASAGYVLEGAGNTLVGYQAGFALSTADNNVLLGATAGSEITTGDGNVVVGNYDGNNGTLDIRTSNNHAVISDGAGTIKQYWDGSGNSVQPAGNKTITNGNLVLGTAGKGIDFSADAHATGMTSELLDDYEEGTWTPTFSSTDATFTYTTQVGWYRKVGNTVIAGFNVEASAAGTVTNSLRLTGLPYAAFSTTSAFGGMYSSNTNFTEAVNGTVYPNDNLIALYRFNLPNSATPTTTGMNGGSKFVIGVVIYATP